MKELTFYRCMLCSAVVNRWDVDKGGCQKCGGRRIKPTDMTVIEKIVQLIKHPLVWKWPDDLHTDEA